jgi:hypothetical protein
LISSEEACLRARKAKVSELPGANVLGGSLSSSFLETYSANYATHTALNQLPLAISSAAFFTLRGNFEKLVSAIIILTERLKLMILLKIK